LFFCPAISFFLALLHKVKRGKRNIDESLLDQLTHIAEEKCQDQGADVAAIHISICHNYDLVVAQLVQVQRLGIFRGSKRYAQRGYDVLNFLVVINLMLLRLLYIEDFSPEGKDCLERPVAALLGRAARGITLDKIKFGNTRIGTGTVGKLAGKSGTRKYILPLYHFPGFAGSMARLGGKDNL